MPLSEAALGWVVLGGGGLSLLGDFYLLISACGGWRDGRRPERATRLVRTVVCGMAATNAVQAVGYGEPPRPLTPSSAGRTCARNDAPNRPSARAGLDGRVRIAYGPAGCAVQAAVLQFGAWSHQGRHLRICAH